jgi:predicted AAA+ superfamily ATPase
MIVDEVQRMPEVLNEVQDLIFESAGGKSAHRFVLTGSSARKLKRSGTNLLAGRAVRREFFTLVSRELGGRFNVGRALAHGTLPDAALAEDSEACCDYLDAYAETYLKEEIKEEALVRKLEPFARFLKVAAQINGQVVNVSSVARDVGAKRPTVESHFGLLVDTLLGFWLPAWRPKAKVKEIASPKFYFFDAGVARTLAGTHREKPHESEQGFLLETFLLNELRAWSAYGGRGAEFFYWRTPSDAEIDIVVRCGHTTVAIEVKSSRRWKREFGSALTEMVRLGKVDRAFGVYLGDSPLSYDAYEVLPLQEFLGALWSEPAMLGFRQPKLSPR